MAGFLLINFTIFVCMKAKVKRAFTCRLSMKGCNVGSIYEGTPERIAELEAKGWVEAEAELPTAHVPKAEKKAPTKKAK
jgi:hypothetical protein